MTLRWASSADAPEPAWPSPSAPPRGARPLLLRPPIPIGLPPLPCAQSQRLAPNLNRCYHLNLEGAAAAAFRARAANAGHLRDVSGQGQRATGEGEGEGGGSGDWGPRRRWGRAGGLRPAPCGGGGRVAGPSRCGLGLLADERRNHWCRPGRLVLGEPRPGSFGGGVGEGSRPGRGPRGPLGALRGPAAERGLGPARPGLWRGVSVGTPGSPEPGGRRPGRRSLGGAGWWAQPRAWLGLPLGSGKAWVGAAGAAVNSTRDPSWSLTSDFLALCL